jgi:hypothetical protein
MSLTVLLALCLLMVMISLLMTLSSSNRVNELNRQNELLRRELEHLRRQQTLLAQQIQMLDPSVAAKLGVTASTGQGGSHGSLRLPKPEDVNKMSPEEKQQLLKQQASQLQVLLETFASQHQGEYPSKLSTLQQFMHTKGLQEWSLNPYTLQKNPLTSEDACLNITHEAVDEGLVENAGKILYQGHPNEDKQIRSYTLLIFDEKGVLLRQDNGDLFSLVSKPQN